jgi:hypothetical protein
VGAGPAFWDEETVNSRLGTIMTTSFRNVVDAGEVQREHEDRHTRWRSTGRRGAPAPGMAA